MTFEGQDLNRMPVDKRVSNGIVQVPEGRQVFKDLSVHDNLRLGAYTRKQGAEVERICRRSMASFRSWSRSGTIWLASFLVVSSRCWRLEGR